MSMFEEERGMDEEELALLSKPEREAYYTKLFNRNRLGKQLSMKEQRNLKTLSSEFGKAHNATRNIHKPRD